jgi:ketosteroid isomerase-like protein
LRRWLAAGLVTLLAGLCPARLASQAEPAHAAAEREVRESIRAYDDALRRRDLAALERFWGPEYVFVNPGGRLVSRDERLASVRSGATVFDSLAVRETDVLVYGETAVQRSRLTATGLSGGEPTSAEFRALVVWVKRQGRWQQVSSQLTALVVRPPPAEGGQP